MNNSEFLRGLMKRADGSLQAWFDAEHVEEANGDGGETNGIADGSPLVDEPSEDDAIEHARWRWKYRPEDGDEVVMGEYNCNLLMSDLDAIAAMVERDYVLRSIFDAVCAERDEWKAKAEDKSAKRAAVAERVRKAKDAGTSIGYAIVGREYYPWEAYEALIDLLTDEPMDAQSDGNGTCPDAMGQSSDAPTLGDLFGVLGDEEPHEENDNREKLEAEVDNFGFIMNLEGYQLDMIRGWLDRQAAIDRKEFQTILEEIQKCMRNGSR